MFRKISKKIKRYNPDRRVGITPGGSYCMAGKPSWKCPVSPVSALQVEWLRMREIVENERNRKKENRIPEKP